MALRMRRQFPHHHRRRTPTRNGLLAVASVAALLALPATAQAGSAFQSVLKAYTQGQGRINPCQFSAAELQSARSQIPGDIAQYAPDFGSALDAALAARARGACSTSHTSTSQSSTSSPSGGSGAPPSSSASVPGAANAAGGAQGVPLTPAPPTGPVLHVGADRGLSPVPLRPARAAAAPAPVVLLGVIGLVAAAIALSGLLIGGTGVGTRRLGRLRHAFSEAGFRVGSTWAEFGDWVRLGR